MPLDDTVIVKVDTTTGFFSEDGGWSEPVRVRIVETPDHGTGYELKITSAE